ncbi:unnamed protein product, partial [Ceratitis capitata]
MAFVTESAYPFSYDSLSLVFGTARYEPEGSKDIKPASGWAREVCLARKFARFILQTEDAEH